MTACAKEPIARLPTVPSAFSPTGAVTVGRLASAGRRERRRYSIVAALCLCVSVFNTSSVSAETYVGLSGSMLLPQGGSKMHRLGGASVRVGSYVNENWAVEGEAAWLENAAGFSAQMLGHVQGWDFYGKLFGYSRFDPFVTIGAKGWIGHDCGQAGPKVGLGAFYHLADNWSLRADADATLGLETDCEMLYTFSAGVQYSF